ncbi:MAG: hypothetical protein IPK96_16950 [Flammeovirgaceae bacterium]|nr:hypothetical protein [Flammeovirgaceae bacterium]
MLPFIIQQVYGAIETSTIAVSFLSCNTKRGKQILYDVTTLYYNAQILHYQIPFIDENLSNAHKLLKNIQLLKEQL